MRTSPLTVPIDGGTGTVGVFFVAVLGLFVVMEAGRQAF